MIVPAPLRCTVVVVNYNGADFVSDCLESLRAQHAADLQFEVVVVDNASVDGSDELIQRRFPEVRMIRSRGNLGFAGGVNLAVRSTDGDLVVLLNPDAVADPGFLEAITAPFRQGADGLAAVSGRIVLTGRFARARAGDTEALVSAGGERWSRLPDDAPADAGVELLNSTGSQMSGSGNGRDRSWLSPVDSATPPSEVFGFCGGAAALRREAIDAVGLFDERLFMYYEDTDLSWRLRRCGWEIRYAADAVVRHRHAASSGTRSRLFLVHNIRNRVLVTARNAPTAMLTKAVLRTGGNLAKTLLRCLSPTTGRDARKQAAAGLSALLQLSRVLPAYLADGRRRDAGAVLARDFIYAWTVAD